MTKNLKVFLATAVGSVSIWWGLNALSEGLTNFFAAQHMQNDPHLAAASASQLALEQKLQSIYPRARIGASPLNIGAQAALSLYVTKEGEPRTLFQKNSAAPVPIASLTKLMTALVAIKNYTPNQHIVITQEILATPGEAGQLQEGDIFPVKDLLYLSLMESSNDAATALAEPNGQEWFVHQMNEEATRLNLQDTQFINTTGLDGAEQSNVSTAEDLALLTRYVFSTHPQVFDILSQRELPLRTPEGRFHHLMRNTNELLGYYDWPARILGGKTGTTPRARQALLFVVESPDRSGYVINIILGSEARFSEMRSLLRWILETYEWEMPL